MNYNNLSDLRTETLSLICKALNQLSLFPTPDGYLRDWRGIIDYLGLDVNLMLSLENYENPSAKLLDIWQNSKSVNIEMLEKAFEAIGRCDLNFIHIKNAIEKDLIQFKNDINTGVQSRFEEFSDSVSKCDALILCANEDIDFANDLLQSSEKNYNLRYSLLNNLKYDIEKDQEDILKYILLYSNRLVVILSEHLIQNSNLMFYVNSAISWMIDQKCDKVVPILYKKCNIPPNMKFFTILDYERLMKNNWFWERLYSSVALHPYDKIHIKTLPLSLQMKLIKPETVFYETNVTVHNSLLEINSGQFSKLAQILDVANSWRKLIAVLPSCLICYRHQMNIDHKNEFVCTKVHNESTNFLNDDAIRLIKSKSEKCMKSCSEILLYEWSTYGPPVPNINDLIHLLNSVKLYRAVDFIETNILKNAVNRTSDIDKNKLDESINRYKIKKVLLLKLHKMFKL